MRNIYKLLSLSLILVMPFCSFAGNPDRVGQAGATELLNNPWARSSGMQGVLISGIEGVEAMRLNVAGLVKQPGTQFLMSRGNYFQGSGIYINSFGFSKAFGSDTSNALGVTLSAFDFGEIEITNQDNPEGGIGTYSPTMLNIGIAYSKRFSSKISGGALVRIINQSTGKVNASGIAIDAGIQYQTDIGGKDSLKRSKFGISLRNVGTPMRFQGSGLTTRAQPDGSDYSLSVDQRSADFELPSVLSIGISQDFYLDDLVNRVHRLTIAAAFISNTFTDDQLKIGAEYSFKDMIMLRAGYVYEDGITNADDRFIAYSGPSAGFTFSLPIKKEDLKRDEMGNPILNQDGSNQVKKTEVARLGVDYSFRDTSPFGGYHTLGVHVNF